MQAWPLIEAGRWWQLGTGWRCHEALLSVRWRRLPSCCTWACQLWCVHKTRGGGLVRVYKRWSSDLGGVHNGRGLGVVKNATIKEHHELPVPPAAALAAAAALLLSPGLCTALVSSSQLRSVCSSLQVSKTWKPFWTGGKLIEGSELFFLLIQIV